VIQMLTVKEGTVSAILAIPPFQIVIPHLLLHHPHVNLFNQLMSVLMLLLIAMETESVYPAMEPLLQQLPAAVQALLVELIATNQHVLQMMIVD